MSTINMVKVIKQVNPDYVVFVKMGAFYSVYGKDAYIISDLFSYKMKEIEEGIYTCGFPEISINKIMAKLEHEKINYIIVDRKNNYDEDEKSDNGNLNKYVQAFVQARANIAYKIRIEKISEKLLSCKNKEKLKILLKKIEDIIKEAENTNI